MAYSVLPTGYYADTTVGGLLPSGQYVKTAASGGVTVSLTGQAVSFTQGVIGPAAAVVLAGAIAAFSQGAVTPNIGGNVTVSLTGQTFSFAQGSVAPALSVGLSGAVNSFAQGTVTPSSSGSFTTDPMENNTGSLMANTAVVWTWWQGTQGIGSTPTSLTHGSGTTSAGGVLSVSGLPAGAGFMLVRDGTGAAVCYQAGTVV